MKVNKNDRILFSSKDGEVPEDVDWCFVLHVSGSDGAVHKVNYKTMVNSKYRFNHNRTGKYSGPKRGSEMNTSRKYNYERPTITERNSPSLHNGVQKDSSSTDTISKSPSSLKQIENDILHMNTNSLCDSDQPRSKISKKESELLEEYRDELFIYICGSANR